MGGSTLRSGGLRAECAFLVRWESETLAYLIGHHWSLVPRFCDYIFDQEDATMPRPEHPLERRRARRFGLESSECARSALATQKTKEASPA